jgi:hypothetical protein
MKRYRIKNYISKKNKNNKVFKISIFDYILLCYNILISFILNTFGHTIIL